MYSKQIDLLDYPNKTISFSVINNKKIFILKLNNETKFINLPNGVFFYKKSNSIFLFSENKYKNFFFSFFNSFTNFLKSYNKLHSKKLILKGLGFKINLINLENATFLNFKLGYSHIIELPILKEKLNIFVKKNKLILRSNDIFFLNNFCKKIKDLKNLNIYNGKGFWYKNEKFFLKTFKKSK